MVYYADEEHPRKRLKLWDKSEAKLVAGGMEEFNSETDSDYTSYWRDWVGWHRYFLVSRSSVAVLCVMSWFRVCKSAHRSL